MSNEHSHEPAGPAPAVSDLPQAAERDTMAAETETESTGIAELKRERDDFYDRLLRKTAEFDNFRKRIERERREQADQIIVELLKDLLRVVDDFDLALKIEAGEGAASYKKGVELIHSKLQDLLRRQGVREIASLGEDFDPNRHEAVAHEVSPEHREGEIIGELRRGYTIGDRLLRPAMVRVARRE
jgi:molecular chaperone GrpE